MNVPVLTVTGARWESELVSNLERTSTNMDVVRRCVDLPDLLATAASGQARAVLVSSDLRRLDREAVARLIAGGVAVIGVVNPDDGEGEERLYRLGIGKIVRADADPATLAQTVAEAVEVSSRSGDLQGGEYVISEPRAALPAQPPVEEIPHYEQGVGTGQMIAVWGPTGAPGRTSTAIAIATELSLFGVPTLLADADVYGGVVAQVLGLLDEAPGLAAACRSANNASLDLAQLARHAREVLPRMRVLTGIQRADRWPELRAAALEQVWDMSKQLAAATVVDTGFSIEQDEELSFDTAAPRRNGATLTTLEAAHVAVVVGSADPIGLQRLVRGIGELRETVPGLAIRVVVNNVRKGPIGSDPEGQIREALARYAGVQDVVMVPYDRQSFDSAMAQGRTLAEVAPSSPARAPLRRLSADLMGITLTRKRGRRSKAR